MKNLFPLITGLLMAALITISPLLHAEKISFAGKKKSELQQSYQSFQRSAFSNSLATIYHDMIATEKGKFEKFVIPGYTKNTQPGSPLLPVKRQLIEIPAGAEVSVRIISFDVQEFDLKELGIKHPLYPAQPPRSKGEDFHEFIYDATAYEKDSFGDEDIVSVDILGNMRGVQIGRMNIAPVKYNPVQNKIKVYYNIEFEVEFTNANAAQTLQSRSGKQSPYFKSLKSQLMNSYEVENSRENFMRYPVKYVIVSDPMFESQLQPFIEWKTKKGYTVVEAYTDDPAVGSTLTEIKAYLQGLYEQGTPDDPAPSFVLFVGDVEQIPAWNGDAGYHYTDLYYCEYTGDYFPEVYYGRFSAQDVADLQPQIDKTLLYEQYLMADPSYLNEVVMVGGMDSGHGNNWANGQINYGTINYFNADHGMLSHTYLYPQSGSHSQDIIGHVSDGVGYGNYTAHCGPGGWSDPSFSVSDVPGLANSEKYGLLVGNCCQSNTFSQNECFGEALLRAEDKGTIGYIGGSNNTYWDPDYYWAVGVGEITENPPPYEETTLGAYDRTFHDHGEDFTDWYMTQDEMIFAGNLAVTEGDPSSAEYYWEIYHLMGDPSVMVYFSEPPVQNVSYVNMVPIGTTTFEITAEPYAYAGVSKDGILHGAGIADENGFISLEIDPFTVPGTADVVVTCQNRQPYIGTLNVASPDGPYIIMNEYTINDEAGNNNGLADFNENIWLNVALENVGSDDASAVTAVISSGDEYLEILSNLNNWGDIASGDTIMKNNAFELQIDEFVPDQHTVNFSLLIEDGDGEQWNADFMMKINAPFLSAGYALVDDSQSGNGNGRLDPGETANLIFPLSNTGHAALYDILNELSCGNSLVTLNSTSVMINTLNGSEVKNAVFNLSISEEMEAGTSVPFYYSASSGAYTVEKEVTLSAGLIMEDFESEGFENFEWTFGGDADWTMCSEQPYEGSFCAQSGEITDDMLSELIIEYDVASDDSISFYKKLSCEDDQFGTNYDNFSFYIDNSEMGVWDGEIQWSREVYPVTEGLHTFKWAYSKDYSVSSGDDCAWVDYIIFPAMKTYVGTGENMVSATRMNIFPNPAHDGVNISLELQENASVSVKLFNVMGQLVQEIANSHHLIKGINKFSFPTNDLNRGIYSVEVVVNDEQRITQKLMITK